MAAALCLLASTAAPPPADACFVCHLLEDRDTTTVVESELTVSYSLDGQTLRVGYTVPDTVESQRLGVSLFTGFETDPGAREASSTPTGSPSVGRPDRSRPPP